MEALEALIVLAMAVGIPFLIAMYLMPKEKNTDYKELYLELKAKYDSVTKIKTTMTMHIQLTIKSITIC